MSQKLRRVKQIHVELMLFVRKRTTQGRALVCPSIMAIRTLNVVLSVSWIAIVQWLGPASIWNVSIHVLVCAVHTLNASSPIMLRTAVAYVVIQEIPPLVAMKFQSVRVFVFEFFLFRFDGSFISILNNRFCLFVCLLLSHHSSGTRSSCVSTVTMRAIFSVQRVWWPCHLHMHWKLYW